MHQIKDCRFQLPSRNLGPVRDLWRNGQICLLVDVGQSVGSVVAHVFVIHGRDMVLSWTLGEAKVT